jgi:predicted hydrocarbon binding protein
MSENLFNRLLVGTLKIDKGQPILLNKVPFVMFPARAMSKFVQKVGEDLGDDYLNQLGYDAGKMVAEEFVSKLNWIERSISQKLKSMFTMFEVMGFGKMELIVGDSKNNRVLLHLTNHPVITHASKQFGNKEKSCIFYRGIFSAHSQYEFGVENCHLIETQCLSKKAKFCEWSFNYFKDKK